MLCLHLENPDPYFCLAAEEYLFKNYSEDIFLLWQSHNAVVIGKHQNAMAEINYRFVRENEIKVCRRISGGGTVFHDKGNVNFSFIQNVASPGEVNFRTFLQPVAEFLNTLGIRAEISGRNDLLIQDKKISGNAQHVFKNRVLHHGTLLFDSDLDNLGNAIRVAPGKYFGKAVQSNRSLVANINQFLPGELNTEGFIGLLLDHWLKAMPGNRMHFLSEEDENRIAVSAGEKFSTWEWNFGYSPKYTFRNEFRVEGEIFRVEFIVEKGIIHDSLCSGTFPGLNQLNRRLRGVRHSFNNINAILKQHLKDKTDDLIYEFF